MGIYSGALLAELNKDRVGEKLYCNLTVHVSGVRFKCHRFMMGTTSGYFNRLFRSKFDDSSSKEVFISGPHGNELHPPTMDLIISYAYTEEICLTDDNIMDVLLAADYLEVNQLKPICVDFLIASLNNENWANTLRIANHLNLHTVITVCLDRFHEVSGNLDFTHFTSSEFQEIIKTQHSKMESKDVFETLLSWIKCDEKVRDKYFDDLVQYVDFSRLEPRYIKDSVFKTKTVTDRPDLVVSVSSLLVDRMLQAPVATTSERKLVLIGGEGKAAERSVVYHKVFKFVIDQFL